MCCLKKGKTPDLFSPGAHSGGNAMAVSLLSLPSPETSSSLTSNSSVWTQAELGLSLASTLTALSLPEFLLIPKPNAWRFLSPAPSVVPLLALAGPSRSSPEMGGLSPERSALPAVHPRRALQSPSPSAGSLDR